MASTLTIPGAKYVVDGNGKRTGVILPLEAYEQLLEDIHDLSIVAKRKKEKPVSLDEMKRRLASGRA
jgi:hypothetical protein